MTILLTKTWNTSKDYYAIIQFIIPENSVVQSVFDQAQTSVHLTIK